MAYGKIKADTLVWDNSGSDVETTVQSLTTPTPEGTAVKSTGESGGTKFLREDGDNTCSWQAVPVPTTITVADESSDTTCFPVFVTAATGNLSPKTGSNITFNSSTGLLSATAVTTTGNVVVGGNLQVDGTTTTVNSSTMTVTDKNIEIAKGAANDAAADGAGITIDSGDGDKTWNWVDATDAWTSSEHIALGDGKQLKLGDSGELTIDHGANTNTHIKHTGAGHIYMQSVNDIYFRNNTSAENYAKFLNNGAVELYYNNFKAFETIDNGVYVYGPEGGSAFFYLYADEGDDNADKYWLKTAEDGTGFYIQNFVAGSPAETSLRAVGGGTTELYYDNTKKIETTTAGVTVTGTVTDSKGDLRSIPRNGQGSAYSLVASDAGKAVGCTANVTVTTALAQGDAVTIINENNSDITIVQGTGLTLYNASSGANSAGGNRTLAPRGICTVYYTASTAAYISGAGLS